jgi:glucose/arabinose dehydrogenase
MELIVISQDGIVIRTRMDGIRMTGRAAQGVSVINVAQGDAVASLATIEMGAVGGGPSGGDELNVLRAGRNYGWPFVSFGRDYWGSRVSPHPSVEGYEDPTVVWLPSIGITGMTFYTGDRFPHWKRNVFVGGLRQGGIPRTGQIQRIVFNERWEELRREPMLSELGQRIRDVRQGPDGLLYVLTAEEDGALLRIEPR